MDYVYNACAGQHEGVALYLFSRLKGIGAVYFLSIVKTGFV